MFTNLSSKQRQSEICELVRQGSDVSVCRLARMFNVSEMTIHRDLNRLEQENLIRRIWGGAMPAERMEFEFDFATRRRSNSRSKKAIAAQAVSYVKPGQNIIIDTGTTTLELAYLIKDMKELTVITPSLAVASVLQFSADIRTVLLGGDLRQGSPDLTGIVTERTLEMFMADIAFQGIDGIGFDGELFNADMRIAEVDRNMRKRSRKTYILSDSSKIGRTDFASNGNLSQVSGLITDSGITDHQLEQLNKYTDVTVVQV